MQTKKIYITLVLFCWVDWYEAGGGGGGRGGGRGLDGGLYIIIRLLCIVSGDCWHLHHNFD